MAFAARRIFISSALFFEAAQSSGVPLKLFLDSPVTLLELRYPGIPLLLLRLHIPKATRVKGCYTGS